MNDKIIRFLKSINLNPDDYDLNFDAIYKDSFKKDLWIMEFVKDNPFTYESFLTFFSSLKNIKYPYKMSFRYRNPINFEQLQTFFNDWHLDTTRFPFNGKMKLENDILSFVYLNKKERDKNLSLINSFKELLDFLSIKYEIKVLPDEEIIIEENVEKTLANKNLKLDEADREESEEHKAKIKQAEDNYFASLEENLRIMKEERERKRLYKRGDYEAYDNYFLIPKNTKTNVDIEGEIYDATIRTSPKTGRRRLVGGIGNNVSAISFSIAENKNTFPIERMKIIEEAVNDKVKKFLRARIKGCAYFDERIHEMSLLGHSLDLLPDKELREDNEPIKRVELHLHTNMSQMDGVNSIQDYIKLAKHMGHKAIALTDHGVVQAFPYAQLAAKNDIKVLYGCEFYMVDPKLNYIFNKSDILLSNATYVCLDLETTGLSARYDKIIEFGAVKIKNGINIEQIDILINPKVKLSESTKSLTHIDDDMLKDKKTFDEVWPRIKEFIGDSIIVTHNTVFDISFLNGELERLGLDVIRNPVIDTLSLSRFLYANAKSHNLSALCKSLDLDVYDDDKAHRADFDAKVLGDVWCALLGKFVNENPKILHSDLDKFKTTVDMYKRQRPSHIIVFAKNKDGLKDLFKLISKSHLTYLAEVPKIPRDEIEKVRNNLIIGSACLNGEIFELAHTRTKKILEKAMKFYDYIEIQPLSHYHNLLHKCKYSKIQYTNDIPPKSYRTSMPMPELKDESEIIRTLQDIITSSDELNIPICATGDVHYLNPEDKIYREIYIATDGINHRPHPLCFNPRGYVQNHDYHPAGEQYYHSTKEMLDEFSYLDSEKAKEIVITNPNKIADMCDVLYPVKDRLYTPYIPNADNQLKELAYNKAKELYGDPLPKEISDRLIRELSRIISDKASYSVNYLLARDIVKKANEDGYFVGSRGSVGSSFVATLLGITEVNPLPPHYYCPNCKSIEWSDDPNYISGIDLPEKKCDKCGHDLIRDGQNIPFETFLGFDEKTTKVPDIDLNFANVYQRRAHEFLRETFGRDHVFRAGTIGTYKDKMAFGCVKDYFVRSLHKKIEDVSRAYQSYLASKCTGVKKTTGQHPGGIILIPKEYDVHDFTPIQHPADNEDANWETTHFEFSTIHETVLKLDLLGHVDPLALKKMGELTHVDFTKIPLGDKRVLSLFSSPNELHLKNNYLKMKTGTMGMPEFGTGFVQGVLQVAMPKTFNDLLVISGITHGTNVWLNNAQTLLENKTAKSLADIIGCRDDIMLYLMKKNVPNDIAFKVMEDVRKGKGLKQNYIEVMKQNDVPDFYIDSCNKIKYLFPRAHATAYVTQAVRVGYFKIYYPLAFYCVFFSTRSDQYDIVSMINGETGIIARLEELKNKKNYEKLSPKEEDIIVTLEMALEMVERGFKFVNIDINKSLAKDFVIDEENNALIPPFIVLDGLGDTAADDIIKARNEKDFTSVDDFINRTRLGKKQVDKLSQMGVFEKVRESDQLSLFDFSY